MKGITREDKIILARSTIDYLHGLQLKNITKTGKQEILEALTIIGLEGLEPAKIDYNDIPTDILMSGEVSEYLKKITKENIQYAKDISMLYLHLFSTQDIYLNRVVRLPRESGVYKFIIFAEDKDRSGFEDFNKTKDRENKIKSNTSNIVLEAGPQKRHKNIAKDNDIGNSDIFIYGGGRIKLDRKKKEAYLYGYSGDYKRVSNTLIYWMTQELKEKGYYIKAEMGVGY